MSRILLISANTCEEPMPVYPIGMALVAQALSRAGHHVRQADLLLLQPGSAGVIKEITQFKPDVIGISVRNIDTVDSTAPGNPWFLADIRNLVKTIKTKTDVPVILGGPGFSIMPEKILDFSGADYGISGEGETAVVNLVNCLEKGQRPDAAVVFSKALLNRDEFVPPLYDENIISYYIEQCGMLNYQTKRGCPFKCTYCSYPIIEGRQIRYQSPEFVVENLKRLKDKFNIDTLFFTDAVFNDPEKKYLEIVELMIKKNCNLKWGGYFRPDDISRDELSLLKASGLFAMEIGSDAACDITLENIGKTFNFRQVLEFSDRCTAAGIPCAHFFMFGAPGETKKTVLEGLSNIERLKNCVVFAFSGIRILPGTGIEKTAAEQGIITRGNDLLRPCYYFSPEIDEDWMNQTIEQSFHRKKGRFFPAEQGYMRMRVLKKLGFKGLLWNMVLQPSKPQKRSAER